MHPSERVKGIDIFVSAADAGSFTAAAERLSLTSSAVGKAIAQLRAVRPSIVLGHAHRAAIVTACDGHDGGDDIPERRAQ